MGYTLEEIREHIYALYHMPYPTDRVEAREFDKEFQYWVDQEYQELDRMYPEEERKC